MNRWKGIPEGNQFSLSRCARMNIEDAKKIDRQTDTCMRTRSTHENVCNSHHHSRMMIRKKEEQEHKRSERERKMRERQRIDVRRAERTRRMQSFFSSSSSFLEATNFVVYLKRREEKNRDEVGARKIEPVGWKKKSM